MTKLTIKITKQTLQKSMMCGVPHNNVPKPIAKSCAVAVELIDIFPTVVVGNEEIAIGNRNKDIVYLPNEAVQFIAKFDSLRWNPVLRLNLPEFEFDIDIPDSWLETIDITEVKKQLENHPNLKLYDKVSEAAPSI